MSEADTSVIMQNESMDENQNIYDLCSFDDHCESEIDISDDVIEICRGDIIA